MSSPERGIGEVTGQESSTQNLVRRVLSKPDVEQMSSIWDKTFEAYNDNPNIGIYDLFKKVVEILPGKIPAQARITALETLESTDKNTVDKGVKSFLLLNLRTFLSAVDYFHKADDEDPQERDEMVMSAVVAITEKSRKLNPNAPIVIQVYVSAKLAIASYLSSRDNSPLNLAEHPFYNTAVDESDDQLNKDAQSLTKKDIDDFTGQIAWETRVPEAEIKKYINYRISALNEAILTGADNDRDVVLDEVTKNEQRDNVEDLLSYLRGRDREIIKMIFGFYGREFTPDEIGHEFGITGERVKQIREKSLKKLRRTIFSHFRWITYS
ncbi:MAG: hypothetical protein M1268_03000 [Patescibacteria group bacterium]|nr:hypothetical protein [Patescibacteria group bacterium]